MASKLDNISWRFAEAKLRYYIVIILRLSKKFVKLYLFNDINSLKGCMYIYG